MIRAVIFDMDGVLVDSEMLYLNLRTSLQRKSGVTLEELYRGTLLRGQLGHCGKSGAQWDALAGASGRV
ncbi:MAG: hypothetical protein ACLR0F_24190 [Eisenbergiella sp.]